MARVKSNAGKINAPYSCMQQRPYSKFDLSDGEFSLKRFVIKIIVGIIGIVGLWGVISTSGLFNKGLASETLRVWPLLAYSILVTVGGFGIYELVKKLKN